MTPSRLPTPLSTFRSRAAATLAAACSLSSLCFAATTPLQPFNTEKNTNGPMPVADVLAQSKLPAGFQLSLFAAEPNVHQPISMATDPKGRLWVAENYTYSEAAVGYHKDLRDRILCFEDADNDGHFDKRTVFWDNAQQLTSVEVGLGGIWALALPNLVFIPDANSDGIPDGPPQIILDGFEFQAGRHTVANGLRWGPDGWLYGRHGIQSTSKIGPPGTPEAQRTSMNVGIWRYHPARRVTEVVAQGTTNPWGMDWDAHGEPFFINTVIGHLWHVIPGAHYRRMYGTDPTPNIFEALEQTADHVHWATGEVWTDVRKGVTDVTSAAGGGHAHTGLHIYQGGQWPEYWNGKLLTINFHGRRLNVEQLERQGSGFVAKRQPDAVFFADLWFRGIDLIAAPDGGLFISDWSDAGECHDQEGIHRTSGRIYKLTYGPSKKGAARDLTALSPITLAQLQSSTNEWEARLARRTLADLAHRGESLDRARTELSKLASSHPNEVTRLRALWSLHVSGGIDSSLLQTKLSGTEFERSWALRLLEDASHSSPAAAAAFKAFVSSNLPRIAGTDPSPLVRLTLASLLQKLSLDQRLPIARVLLGRAEDQHDKNIPLLLWYGIEPLNAHPEFVNLVASSQIPRAQRLASRRLAEGLDSHPQPVNDLLVAIANNAPPQSRQAVLDGLADGFAGRRKVPKPKAWPDIEPALSRDANDALSRRINDLGALFGDGRALDQIKEVALNTSADLPRRRAALQSLIDARADNLLEVCQKLLPIRELSGVAASGLALFPDPTLADQLIAEWPRLYGPERPPVLNALLSRPAWAAKLLDAIAANKIRRTELGVAQARQIKGFDNPTLSQRLTEVWGALQDPDQTTRQKALASWRAKLTPAAVQNAKALEGQKLYAQSCGACHKLYGTGGNLGPELTGSGRQNLDYLLENILFPSAVVAADFRQTTVNLKDGRSLSGIVRSRSASSLVLQMIGETTTLNRSDIEDEETAALSLMPEGLLDTLSESQVLDLFAYLMSTAPPASH